MEEIETGYQYPEEYYGFPNSGFPDDDEWESDPVWSVECRRGEDGVPVGLVLQTDDLGDVLTEDGFLTDSGYAEIESAVAELADGCGMAFGDSEQPLIFHLSLPERQGTILYVGISGLNMTALGERYGSTAVQTAYAEFVRSYAGTVRQARESGGDTAPSQDTTDMPPERPMSGMMPDPYHDLESACAALLTVSRNTGQRHPTLEIRIAALDGTANGFAV